MRDDIVFDSDFDALYVARGNCEFIMLLGVLTDSSDTVPFFEVAGVVLAGKCGADERLGGIN